ncbi:MAG: PAC2 family protein [Desulfomonilaceae bacterium]|nr:PAC2 family protein [Desulfomonilaceae bacterium]
MNDREATTSPITWEYTPDLTDPVVVVGFHGWSNAGGVSSDTVEYLIDALKPRRFARLSEELFINCTLERPIGHIEDGVIHDLESMNADLHDWNNPDGEHDLILLLGREPHYNWSGYSRILLDAMDKLNATRLYTIGGVQDTISHTVPPIVSVVASSPHIVAETARLDEGIRAADYYGPVSVHSFLIRACSEAGIEGVSLWGHVPAYLQKSPRVVAKMITILNNAAVMDCPTDELTRKSIEMDRKIHDALVRDPNLKKFVETVERRRDPVDPAGHADKVIRLNDFLHRDPQGDTDR